VIAHMALTSLRHSEYPSPNSNAARVKSGSTHRLRRLRVLFAHSDASVIEDCLLELKRGQFTVKSDTVANAEECAKHLQSRIYDVIVAEYDNELAKDRQQTWQALNEVAQDTPLIFLTSVSAIKLLAEQHPQVESEFVAVENLAQLSMVVRRVLNQKQLHAELVETEIALRHSQSRYRALVENPSYGICRCDAEGKILDVNQALLAMLGYERAEELLEANRAAGVVIDLGQGRLLESSSPELHRFEPVEMDWNRKNGTVLKTKLSGRDAFDENGNFDGCEIIVVDITEQQRVEDQLRREASSDSLTGLANHRRLFDVLQAEIARSRRTGREFSLVLLDLDGLKMINDRYGHLGGDRALCRLAEILKDCCRNVDTAARHGGDEFAVVLPETCGADATMVAQRVCKILESETEAPALTVSVGIASFPGAGETIGALICSADRALYAMKEKRERAAAALGAIASS
jgi:diguanylate cyclase (GGDEF)-like protein/PAS domain S-box-containing protein